MMLWNFFAIAISLLKPKKVSVCSFWEIKAAIASLYQEIQSSQKCSKVDYKLIYSQSLKHLRLAFIYENRQ